MDGLTVGQYFCKLNEAYIIGYFDRSLKSRRFSAEAMAYKARQLIVQMRRERDLDAKDARDLFDEAEDLSHTASLDECGGAHRESCTGCSVTNGGSCRLTPESRILTGLTSAASSRRCSKP